MMVKSKFKKFLIYSAVACLLMGSFPMTTGKLASAETITKTIIIDGTDVDVYNRFKGFGTVSGNNTSRLMVDYKEEHPEAYWEIMNKLFNKDTGAGLTHVKVELGADVDSSSGTEPATMRYADEPANVLRGAGFQFAADAKLINPDITTEILRWGEPRWTWNGAASQQYENRYQWFKQTIDAVYEEYGFKLDYIGISQNERAQNNGRNELEWLKYYTTRIKDEPNYETDYKTIKLVGGEGYRDTRTISRTLLDHPDLIDEIDVISTHYGLSGSSELTQLQNKLIDEGKKPKEVWSSEGVAPMINARYRLNMEPQYQGIGGPYGIVDVTSRIISMYAWTGTNDNPLRAVSFDFQPAVAAFYQGSSYNPKHLISAYSPWSGFYEVDGGLQGVRHVMNFVGYDDPATPENERWMYVKGATFSDGAFADGGVEVDTSTHNYMTLKDEQTDDYTTVFANNTRNTRIYTIIATNLNGKENAPVYVWESRGPDAGQSYDANWFKKINIIMPVDGEYEIEVKPYSLVTISTLDKETEIEGFEYQAAPVDLSQDTILPLPYTDDYEYEQYAIDEQGRDYVDRRGGTPRYTTDQRGAFEVVKRATKPQARGSAVRVDREIPDAAAHGNMLQQKITHDIIGADWAVWGGMDGSASNSNPHTTFGDYRWVNYKVSYDFLLDDYTPAAAGRSNYALIGLRHVKAGGTDSHAPYNARIFADGRYEILKLGTVVNNGVIAGFDPLVWNNMAFEAKENVFSLYLNGALIATYTDVASAVMSGRVAIGSGYYETLFDNLRVDPIEGYPYESVKYDSAQGKKYASEAEALNNNDTVNPIGYVGDWNFSRVGYAHFNRTRMTATTDTPVSSLLTVGFEDAFDGLAVQTVGPTEIVKIMNDETLIGDDENTVYAFRKNNVWGSNSTNAWANFNDDPYILVNFTGTGIDYRSGTGDQTAYHFELDGVDMGNHHVNTSTGVRFSVRDLEETRHTLKISLKDNVRQEAFMDFRAVDIYSTLEDVPMNKVVYRGEWASNPAHAWGSEGSSFTIKFAGTDIKLFGQTGPTHGSADIYLNDALVGEANYLNNSEVTRVVWSAEELEDQEHTLRVVAKDSSISFYKAEIGTSDPVVAIRRIEPTQIVKILDDESLIGDEENTVYAFRKNNVWGSNSTNAWANFNDDPYILVNFTGTGIDYRTGTGDQTAYHFELDGEDMGNYHVDPSTGVRFSARGLEEARHTLKVSLKDNVQQETFMDYRAVDIYSTPNPDSNNSSMIFHFEGTGFQLFGATPEAVIDVYIDNQLIDANVRLNAMGDRQTSYYIWGLEEARHTAKVVVKGGTFHLEGMDIITSVRPGGPDPGPGPTTPVPTPIFAPKPDHIVVSGVQVTNQINDPAISEVVMTLPEHTLDRPLVIAEVSALILRNLAASGKPLVIQSGMVEITIPAAVVASASQSSPDNMSVQIRVVTDGNITGASAVSNLYDLAITTEKNGESTTISTFSEAVTVQLPVLAMNVDDARKVAAYKVAGDSLQYKGGKYDNGILIFKTNGFSEYAAVEQDITFADIQAHWAKDAIEVLASRTLTNGKAANLFAPNDQLTRAEFAVLIARALLLPTAAYEGIFEDVAQDRAWAYEGIEAAYRAGIINGRKAAVFDPDALITREELATMIMRAMAYANPSVYDDLDTTTTAFNDASAISGFAEAAAGAAQALGIIQGKPGKLFDPQGLATRAEAAAMLYRALESLDEF